MVLTFVMVYLPWEEVANCGTNLCDGVFALGGGGKLLADVLVLLVGLLKRDNLQILVVTHLAPRPWWLK